MRAAINPLEISDKSILQVVRDLIASETEETVALLTHANSQDLSKSSEFGLDVSVADPEAGQVSVPPVYLIDWGEHARNVNAFPLKDITFKYTQAEPVKEPETTKKTYDREWMENQLVVYYGGTFTIPLSDLIDTIMNVICSSRSDEELQTEVCKLLQQTCVSSPN